MVSLQSFLLVSANTQFPQGLLRSPLICAVQQVGEEMETSASLRQQEVLRYKVVYP
jgi:hypothetical protein